jgi:hypothetical protein
MNLRNEIDIVRFEKENFDKVVIYFSSGEFYNATMHSAMFMLNII